jgi:choline dehydrogenase-like flavoprotein
MDGADRPAFPEPHRGVARFEDYGGRELRAKCEVVVVGSGPGGAVAAKELAEAGRDVILLEEGPPFGRADFVQEAAEAMQRMLREGGTRATRGASYLPTMQAIALGGGSLVNSAICARAPAWTFAKWGDKTGVALSRAALDPHYERVEKFLWAEPTPLEVQGDRNLLFKRGCDALGLSSEPTLRNARGCKGSGECFTGCRNGAKQSTDVSYVPTAIAAGARVFTSVRAEQVRMDGRRATGLRGRVIEPFSWEPRQAVEIEASCVVLAAGCMATPLLLLRSGVGNERWVGRDLQLHPGLAIMGVFPDVVDPWKGATQGYHSLHFLDQGIKLEVLWSPVSVLAARMPGLGHDYQKHLLDYRRMAPFDVIVAAERSSGAVRPRGRTWEPDLTFTWAQEDVDLIQKGIGILSDICWAAGATHILPGLHGVPEILRSKEEAEIIRTKKLRGSDSIAAANHAFGTTRMSRRPEDGVVDEDGRCHGTENLYVTDTGIFPGSPAVNPMLTCMALSDRIARRIAARW